MTDDLVAPTEAARRALLATCDRLADALARDDLRAALAALNVVNALAEALERNLTSYVIARGHPVEYVMAPAGGWRLGAGEVKELNG